MGHSWQFALTAVFIEGILFIILSLFKIREQIANAIPGAATGSALVIVGVLMCSNAAAVAWEDYSEAIPAFVTLLLTPLSYSISDGIMLGTIMFVLMKVCKGKQGIRQISPTMWVLFVLFLIRYIQRSLT